MEGAKAVRVARAVRVGTLAVAVRGKAGVAKERVVTSGPRCLVESMVDRAVRP